MKKQVFCIVGESGSGKSTILDAITTTDYLKFKRNKLIYYTTRDRRDGETDGVDYHFIDMESMKDIPQDKILESRIYITNSGPAIYFTMKDDIAISDCPIIAATSPEQAYKIAIFCNNNDIDCNIIRIITDTKDRVINLMYRCDDDKAVDEAIRRLYNEREEFRDYLESAKRKATRYVEIQNNYRHEDIIKFSDYLYKIVNNTIEE